MLAITQKFRYNKSTVTKIIMLQSVSQHKDPTSYKIAYKAVSLLIFVCFFTVVPGVLKIVWPSLIELASSIGETDVWVYVIVALSSNIFSLVCFNCFMWLIYSGKISCFENFRVNPQVPWPWQKDRQTWNKTLRKTLLLVTFNTLVVNFCMTYGQKFAHKLQYNYSVQSWPTPATMLLHFLIFFTFNQFFSHVLHSQFHTPLLYRFHKIHHEYTTTISLTATYAHPIEYIFSNIFSTAICVPLLSLVTQVHLVTAGIWFCYRMFETIEVHSGYEWPWGCMAFLPWKNQSRFHDFHHSHNAGTYGSMLRIVDSAFSTDKEFNKYYKLE